MVFIARISVGAHVKIAGLHRRFYVYPLCYNGFMTLKDDLKAYRERWSQVEKVVQEERRSASIALRWKQLNSAYAMAKGLGLLQTDPSELEVFQTWAKLKEKSAGQNQKA
jgi:hypothetical protein